MIRACGRTKILCCELIDTLWNVNDIDKYALDFMGE